MSVALSTPPIALSGEPVALDFAQSWEKKLETDFRPGRVYLSRSGDLLHIRAELIDDDVFTRATGNNQRLWQLGDAFEIFIQSPERDDYHELHVSPQGHTLQLHFPDSDFLRNNPGSPLEERMIDQPLFSHRVEIQEAGWNIHVDLPLPTLWPGTNLDCKEVGRISFGRYDYSRDRVSPVLSATSPFTQLSFHRVHEWTPICFF